MGERSPTLSYFDPGLPVGHVRGGNLPHWRQDGGVYFVTWRTADSMPAERVRQWGAERAEWLARHPEPHSPEERGEYARLFAARWERWLDESHGECLLRKPELGVLVEASLLRLDGHHYVLHEWVVMPNHVHVLVGPLSEHRLSAIVQVWKSATSHAINHALGRTGAFWQKESFDHLVRNADEMERIRSYIRRQGQEAGARVSQKPS